MLYGCPAFAEQAVGGRGALRPWFDYDQNDDGDE